MMVWNFDSISHLDLSVRAQNCSILRYLPFRTNAQDHSVQITSDLSLNLDLMTLKESRRRELNPRPADYESAAMPG